MLPLLVILSLAEECAKLEPVFEKAIAEEGLAEELAEWPKY